MSDGKMGYARTQEGAKWRVERKRALRRAGITVNPAITNKELIQTMKKIT